MSTSYLVLRNFWSYGQYLQRGELVSEDKIRSPRLKISDGKIVPAVSSSPIPATNAETALSPDITGEDNNKEKKLTFNQN